jgi:hypothetical protein
MTKIKITKQAPKVAYAKYASSFWLDRDFDTSFKVGNSVDYTKLAAAQRAIGNFVNIVTGQQIPVVFQNNDSSYTDGNSVTIGTKLDGTNFDPAVGLALHEGSHIAYTDFSLFKTLVGAKAYTLAGTKFASIVNTSGIDSATMDEKKYGIIKDLLNWIEDRRIDYKIYTMAPGYRMYYESMYAKYFNDKVIDTALIGRAKVKENWDCYMFHIINFTNVNRKLDSLVKLRDVWNLIDLGNIQRLTSTMDALTLSCEVYKLIAPAVMAVELEEVEQIFKDNEASNGETDLNTLPGSGAGDDDDDSVDDGDGPGGGGGSSDDDDESVDGATEDEEDDIPELSDKDKEKLEKAIEAQREFLNGAQKKTGKLSKAQAQLVNAMRESGTETREVNTSLDGKMNPVTTVVIKKLTPGVIAAMPNLFASNAADFIQGKRNLDSYSAEEIRKNDAAVTRGLILGKQLGNKLQLRNADRSLKSTRLAAGKIDRRLVAQLGFDNVNVFHRIVTDRFKNYFIHISIDASGSMGGNKLHQAITSAVAVAQAASMTTGIRVQISVRGTNSQSSSAERCVTIYAYDSAHDKMSKIRNYFKYLSVYGCTPEGLAFKSIEKDLRADARGDELIFINYSDGAPTGVTGCGYSYNGVTFTKKVISDMREIGMNIISYFIYENCVYDSDRKNFKTMYGPDSQFIRPDSVVDIAKTINQKFLEIAK